MKLRTSKGYFTFKNHILDIGSKAIIPEIMTKCLGELSAYLDRIGINWGPAFGTLIGIIRNDGYLPWSPNFDLYILKEDEERFKDILWTLNEAGFSVVRYERRGLYYLEKNNQLFKIFVLHKISFDVRHTGGTDFIHEKYIQNTVKWEFKGILLNVPSEVDDYLTFQYGDWTTPEQTVFYKGFLNNCRQKVSMFIQDIMPDGIYYTYIYHRRKNDFERFKKLCENKKRPLPENVELSSMKPRKHKRVLTVGVYDLLHKGHIELFRRAKGLGDHLIVAVQDGDLILKYKPQAKVLNSTEDRVYMVQSIKYVDEVIVYGAVDEIVKDVDFDVFVSGPDQTHSGFQSAIRWCEEHGKEFIILARTDGVSSSELKEKIAKKTKLC